MRNYGPLPRVNPSKVEHVNGGSTARLDSKRIMELIVGCRPRKKQHRMSGDRSGQKQTEADRSRQKQTGTDRSGQKWTDPCRQRSEGRRDGCPTHANSRCRQDTRRREDKGVNRRGKRLEGVVEQQVS